MTEIIDRNKIIVLRVSESEKRRLDNAWKKRDDCFNRAQFVKIAINTLAGEEICTRGRYDD